MTPHFTKTDTAGEVNFSGTSTFTNTIFRLAPKDESCVLKTSPAVSKLTKSQELVTRVAHEGCFVRDEGVMHAWQRAPWRYGRMVLGLIWDAGSISLLVFDRTDEGYDTILGGPRLLCS
jgi:hypothetical protein